jgi:Carbohydrate esterase, sialic acid-specific acetylesterase
LVWQWRCQLANRTTRIHVADVRKYLILFLSFISAASAGELGSVSAPDPYTLQTGTSCCGNVPDSKTPTSQFINPAIPGGNLIIIGSGQSNIGDNHGAAYIPTNGSKIDNMYIYDGGVYSATDPLLGSVLDGPTLGPGNFVLRLADDLITTNGFGRVILCPIQVSGSAIASWDTGVNNDRFKTIYKRLAAKGITPGISGVTIVILWVQGEQDNANGTTQSAYATAMSDVIAQARNAGFTQGVVPFFVGEQTWIGSVSTPVQNAQIAAVNHSANIWAGANGDILTGSVCGAGAASACRQADNTHFTPTGAYSFAGTGGGGWRAALHAFGAPF